MWSEQYLGVGWCERGDRLTPSILVANDFYFSKISSNMLLWHMEKLGEKWPLGS